MALYDSDFNGIRFRVQLETLSEYWKEIVDIGSVRTVTEANIEVKNHLCEVYKLAKLIMECQQLIIRQKEHLFC